MLLLAALPLAIQRIGCLRVAWRGSDRRRARGVQRCPKGSVTFRDGGDGGEAVRRGRSGVVAGGRGRAFRLAEAVNAGSQQEHLPLSAIGVQNLASSLVDSDEITARTNRRLIIIISSLG